MTDQNQTPRVFISYRRGGGAEIARLIEGFLDTHGLSVFLDVDSLGGGHFDEQILRQIKERDVFILICSPGCFDRCSDPGDWVRRELEHGISLDKRIVPVTIAGFSWPRSEDLPESIRAITRQNAFEYTHNHWKRTRDSLLKMIGLEARRPTESLPRDDSISGRTTQLDLDDAVRIRLRQAEKLLYSEFKVDEAHAIIQPLYDVYARRDQSLWRLFMTSLTEFDPDGALQLFESLDVDEPAAYLHRIEIKARQGPRGLDEAVKLIKLAQQKFPDAQDWSMMQAECHMEEFRQARDPVWLELADKCLRHDRMPDEWLWVKAKLDYLQNRDRDALNRLKEKLIPGTLPYYRVVRAQKYLQVGSMKLIMRGEDYPCRSGDVIGRHGTVATGVMSVINTLSRRHAQVVLRAGQWHIKVLATTNASTLNGKPIEAGRFYPLGLEQTVRLSTQCEFELRTTISH